MPSRNLVNLSEVSKEHGARTILADLTLGVTEQDRIGVVGANGAGKSTLLSLIAGATKPDTGNVVAVHDLRCVLLDQSDRVAGVGAGDEAAGITVANALLGKQAEHEWAGNPRIRTVLDGLLGGVGFTRFGDGAQTELASLSGGERRRVGLASALIADAQLLLLDEPTNHLDIEAIDWLAAYLTRQARALMVVTHDRWFLDAVCTATWEVADTSVYRYDGGYAAYILAKAERERLEAVAEDRRRQLVRKELAWLRRGPPARTSKPKFRLEAASALIADEPPVRDSAELLRFAGSRLGNKVLEAESVSFAFEPGAPVIHKLTWRLGPGERVALVGVNGSGKTTLLRLLAGELSPDDGKVERGATVHLAYLPQSGTTLPEEMTVNAAVAQVRRYVRLADGSELTAERMVERLGFRGERAHTPVAGLSGGERRRLAIARLLMEEPNVLLLDEPTNDLDIETLNALEDLLDRWSGTLVLISHDRYFVERVCDNVYALAPGGGIRHLPGGIEQYLSELSAGPGPAGPGPDPSAAAATSRTPARSRAAVASAGGGQASGATNHQGAGGAPAIRAAKPGNQLREARKQLARLERELERLSGRAAQLQELMAAAATDHQRLSELTAELQQLTATRDELEARWLTAAELVEG
jgi:ATP-binding cassette subfamily F protein uup